MIAEAIDAAIAVGWALLAWIVLTAVVATAALYAVVAVAWWDADGVDRPGVRNGPVRPPEARTAVPGPRVAGTGRTALRATNQPRPVVGSHRHRGSRMTHTDPEPPPDDEDNGPWCRTRRTP